MELHPGITERNIEDGCPEHYLPIETVRCPTIEFENSNRETTMCQFCWNKEFKEG